MTMQQAGDHASAVESMFSEIQNVKHVVRALHRSLKLSFGGGRKDSRRLRQLQGVGQGNGTGPTIWSVISTVFFDLLRN